MSAEIASVPNTPVVSQQAPVTPAANVSEPRPAGGGGKAVRIDVTPAEVAAARAEVAQPTERPGWLPEKFKSPEDLAQAYAQLEQRLGQGSPAPAGSSAAAPAGDAGGGAGTPAGAQPGGASLMDRMTQAYASTGAVGPELRQEFTKTYPGLPESVIDNQIAYIQAQGRRTSEMAVKRLGSEQAVQELMDWAGKRLSESERKAFNRLAYSQDEAAAQLAIDGLAAKYEAEVGRSPRIIAGRKPQDQYRGVVPFQSPQEWGAARKDPRYKSDPAYRQQVEDQLAASMKLGLI